MHRASPYHYELVVAKDSKSAKENPIVVNLTDHAGKTVPSAGATGSATLLAGRIKAAASLVPDGDNRLKGFAHYASVANMKVVVSITFPGKNAEQARFTPLAAALDAPQSTTSTNALPRGPSPPQVGAASKAAEQDLGDKSTAHIRQQ